jgi:Spy/CpxP family protein refolding chaperone
MKHNKQILTALAAAAFFVAVPSISAQTVQNQQPGPTMPQQRRFAADPIRQLNLSPQQLEQIRTIRQQNQKERVAINERVRQTNQALEAVLDAESPDEALVEQRMQDASAAQAAAMRMRILTEVRIRKVLNAEQRALLKNLRQEAANQLRRERPVRNPEERLRRREDQRGLQNQRNGMGPLLPPPDLQRKARPLDQQ